MYYISLFNKKLGEYGSAIAYLAVFAITVYDIGMRYFFNAPTVWGLELVTAVAGVHYVLAGGYALEQDSHVRIDVIYKLLPQRVQMIMDVVSYVLILVFLGIVIYYGFQQAYPAIQTGETSGGGWDSYAPTVMKTAIPVGGTLMALQAISCLKRAIGRLRHEW